MPSYGRYGGAPAPRIQTKPSTGRAKCRICQEKIRKGTSQVSISFRSYFGQKEIHFHLSCIIKEGRNYMTENEAASLFSINNWRNVLGEQNGI